jgi:thioredoxin
MNSSSNKKFGSKKEFEFFLRKSEEPIVIIINADWCGSCQIMIPIIEKLANEFTGKIRFVNVDNEDLENLELNFDSDVLPKILLFNQGKIEDQLFGTASFEFLEKKMQSLIEVS